jgi:hypothetical protein
VDTLYASDVVNSSKSGLFGPAVLSGRDSGYSLLGKRTGSSVRTKAADSPHLRNSGQPTISLKTEIIYIRRERPSRSQNEILHKRGENLHVVQETDGLKIFKGLIKLIFEVQVDDGMVNKMRPNAWKVMYNRDPMLFQMFSRPNAR